MIPQALRVIIPPLTSQYLNLTKNCSLAVAIGYPDLVSSFAGTTLNQTGQAVEVIAITMAVYLTLSLLHLGVHELVQPAHGAGGAVAMAEVHAETATPRATGRVETAGAADRAVGVLALDQAEPVQFAAQRRR